jgi:ribosomal protein L3 glutamine methyltransferase
LASLSTAPRRGTFLEWVRHAERRFEAARLAFGHGTRNARDEAVWLLARVLGLSFDQVQSSLDRVLSGAESRKATRLLEERIRSRKPLAYLLREAWLAGVRFYVDERVIVPRSFIGELLPGGLAPWLPRNGPKRVLDLCTGSGCLAILAARAYSKAWIDASDVSRGALAVAKRNLAEHRLSSRVHLIRSDLFAVVPPAKYDLIISNPPYVDSRAMERLPAEYRHEPGLALAGGSEGLDAVLRIIDSAALFLAPGGALVVEIGHTRKALEQRAAHLPFTWLPTSAGDDMVFLLTREQLLPRAAARGR